MTNCFAFFHSDHEKCADGIGQAPTIQSLDPMKPLRDNLRKSYDNFMAKLTLVQDTVPKDARNVMDAQKMMLEIQGSMEELQNVKQLVAADYEDTVKALTDQNNPEGVVKFGNFASMIPEHSAVVETLKKKVCGIVQKYEVTPEGKVARKIRAISTLVNETDDGLSIYRPPFKKVYENKASKIRSFRLGPKNPNKPIKVIMMVGMTGSGKSLHINNILNYILGVNYSDDFRFKLILEEDELNDRHPSQSRSLAESMTRYVTSYVLNHRTGFRVDYSLVLIDTPGFADSSGIDKDEETIKSIKEFFNDKKISIREILNINLIIQASTAKLTDEQCYVFNSVLDIFGKDVAENISILFTFADAQPPPALQVIKKAEIPHCQDATFKFNNSAVYAGKGDLSTEFFWKFGYDSLQKYFYHLGSITPASLDQTKEVLHCREELQFYLEHLRQRIDEGMDKLKSIETMTIEITRLQGTLKANKNFKVQKTVYPQTTEVVKHFITNCLACMHTCHTPCGIKGDVKDGCWAMTNNRCRICPGKCPPESHKNGDRYEN
jgi:GTP-binding protein EngB required for normal cell division